jgi:hypothetical protein
LLIVAAAAGSVSAVGPRTWQQIWGLVSAVSIAAAILLRWVNRYQHLDHRWYKARGAAETVKADSWRYMMHVYPYGGDDEEAKKLFVKRLDGVRTHYSDRWVTFRSDSTGPQISPSMTVVRGQSLPERQQTYIERRLHNQIDWYKTKQDHHRRRGRWLVALLVGAEVAALGWLLARYAFSWNINIIGVFTSLAVAATALSQLNAHEELVQKYTDAKQKLQEILTVLPTTDKDRFGELVRETEATIATENNSWVAKRS